MKGQANLFSSNSHVLFEEKKAIVHTKQLASSTRPYIISASSIKSCNLEQNCLAGSQKGPSLLRRRREVGGDVGTIFMTPAAGSRSTPRSGRLRGCLSLAAHFPESLKGSCLVAALKGVRVAGRRRGPTPAVPEPVAGPSPEAVFLCSVCEALHSVCAGEAPGGGDTATPIVQVSMSLFCFPH